MRIRKNAKTSATATALFPTNSTNNQQTTLCLLNQSPWDIITFPSIHPFDDYFTHFYVNVPANWTSADSDRAIHSANSTNKSYDCKHDVVNGKFNNRNRNRNVDDEIKSCEMYEELGFMKGCVKKEDNVNVVENDAVWSTKKAQTRGTKKRAVAVAQKQNEFYYYSGFGPSWGKKRGGLEDKCTTFNARVTTTSIDTSSSRSKSRNKSSVCETSDDVGDLDVEEEDEKRVELDTSMMQAVWSCKLTPEMSESEDSDCVEDDDQGNEKEKERNVKKRGRKPIKARSLKSLM